MSAPQEKPRKQSQCPSAPCEEGNLLLGRVLPDGRIAYAGQPLYISEVFVEEAKKGTQPESRFRFAAPCRPDDCARWGGSCQVADWALQAYGPLQIPKPQQSCLIQAECRWFQQAGEAACGPCSVIHTVEGE